METFLNTVLPNLLGTYANYRLQSQAYKQQAAYQQQAQQTAYLPAQSGISTGTLLLLGGVAVAAILIMKK